MMEGESSSGSAPRWTWRWGTLAARGLALCALVQTTCERAERPDRRCEIAIPPYLEYVVFDLEGERVRSGEVRAPGESKARAVSDWSGGEIRWGRRLATLVIHRPRSGIWRFRGVAVRLREWKSLVRGRLREPSGAVSARAGRCDLAYEAVGLDGHPLVIQPSAPLEAEAVVVHPDGRGEPIALVAAPDLSGVVFRSPRPLDCAASGLYWIEVTLAARDPLGRTRVLYRDSASGFRVGG